MPPVIANSFHKDLFSKATIAMTSFICIGIMTTVYGAFRSELVLSDDLDTALEPLEKAIVLNSQENKETRKLVVAQNAILVQIAANQVDDRIDRFEESIRILEAQAKRKALNPEDAYRLSRYRDDLEKEKLKRKN